MLISNDEQAENFKHLVKDCAKHILPQDICFFFEETTEQFQSTGVRNNLMQQLVAFRGVTENDIKKHSSFFNVSAHCVILESFLIS